MTIHILQVRWCHNHHIRKFAASGKPLHNDPTTQSVRATARVDCYIINGMFPYVYAIFLTFAILRVRAEDGCVVAVCFVKVPSTWLP